MSDAVMRKLQEYDQYICQVLDISSETSLYKFDAGNNKWEKLNVDGTFFLCKRTMVPFYCFFISSSTGGGEILKEKLTKDMMIQLQAPFLLYKRTGEVKGILFKEERECHRVASIINQLLKEMSISSPREGGPNPVKSVAPSTETPSAGGVHQTHSSNPIPQAQVNVTNSGQNSIIRMLHSAAAKHSPAPTGPKVADTGRARPQTIGGPQQPLHHPMPQPHTSVTPNSHNNTSASTQPGLAAQSGKSAGHWSNKTHTISVDYLFKSLGSTGGQRSPPRTSSPKQTPMTPTQPVGPVAGQPVSTSVRPASGANYLTLSEVEQRAMVEASECLRQQLGISGGNDGLSGTVSGRGDGRSTLHQSGIRKPVPEAPNSMARSNFSSAVVAVDEDGEDEEGLVLTPNMMEQTIINTVFPGPVNDGGKAATKSPVAAERPVSATVDAVALNKSQLREALITLIEEDDDFITRIHRAYIQNLQRHLK